VHLVAEGIADVADVDRAIAYGPGMRWALMGPHLIYHLGGGAAGYRGYLEHLGSTQEARWDTLGAPTLDEHTKAKLIDGIARELEELDAETLIERRDAALVALARLKASFDF
jgi:carnitine 3-dehydrogenase